MIGEWQEKVEERIALLKSLSLSKEMALAVDIVLQAFRDKHMVFFFGNGGSATQASHIACEMVNRFYLNREGLRALALTTDLANVTAIANDVSFEQIFARQLDALGKTGDVAIGMTTSGRSPNILAGLSAARKRGLKTISLCGSEIQLLKDLHLDCILSVPSQDTPAIQEIQLFLLHFLAEKVEKEIFSMQQ